MTKFKGIASHLLCLILLLLIVSHNTSSNYYRQNMAIKQTFDGNIKVTYHHCVMQLSVAEMAFLNFQITICSKTKTFLFSLIKMVRFCMWDLANGNGNLFIPNLYSTTQNAEVKKLPFSEARFLPDYTHAGNAGSQRSSVYFLKITFDMQLLFLHARQPHFHFYQAEYEYQQHLFATFTVSVSNAINQSINQSIISLTKISRNTQSKPIIDQLWQRVPKLCIVGYSLTRPIDGSSPVSSFFSFSS